MNDADHKRILMISTHGYFENKPSFGRPDTGGQVVFVIELSKALSEFGYQVDILSRQFAGYEHIEPVSDRVRIVRIPCGGKDFIPKEYLVDYLPELVEGFAEYVDRNKLEYTLIDAHYWDAGYVGTKLAARFDVPLVFTPHSLGKWKETRMKQSAREEGQEIDEEEMEEKYNFRERNATETSIMEDAYKVIATTPTQRRIISSDYGIDDEKIMLLTPGFSETKFRKLPEEEVQSVREEYGLPSSFVLTVGRITPYKGYNLAIKAFRQVVQQEPEAHLVLAVGSHEQSDVDKREELARLAESIGVRDKVMLYGYIEKLEAFYNAAHAFVQPSTYEPFGMVAIESMACGTPAVVTSHGGLKDFVEAGEEALVVDPLDTESLARAILELLRDRQLHDRLSRLGYKKAHSRFTWKHIAGSMLDLLLGNGG